MSERKYKEQAVSEMKDLACLFLRLDKSTKSPPVSNYISTFLARKATVKRELQFLESLTTASMFSKHSRTSSPINDCNK
jgi:hypothetical protein